MKKIKVKPIAFHARAIMEHQSHRLCVKCPSAAKWTVFRVGHMGGIDRSSRQFACDDHANETLWVRMTPVTRLGLAVFPRLYQNFKGDQSMFYRDIMREVGGEVPMPDREKEAKPRKKCWPRMLQMTFEPNKKRPGSLISVWA